MNHSVLTSSGNPICHCVRLRRGDDLMLSIKELCREKHIAAGVVLSAVGCISQGRIRDASGVTIRDIQDHCELSASTVPSAKPGAICTLPCPKKI